MSTLIKAAFAALAAVAMSIGTANAAAHIESELSVSRTGVAAVDCRPDGDVLEVQLPIAWRGGGGDESPVDWRLSLTLNGVDLNRIVGKWGVPAASMEPAAAASAIRHPFFVIAQVESSNMHLVISAASGSIRIARLTDRSVEGDWDLTFVEFSDVRHMTGHFTAALEPMHELHNFPPGSQPRSAKLPCR